MSFALFDNMPLREQDLSRNGIYLFRLSTALFVICAIILVVFDMLLGIEIGKVVKTGLQGVMLFAVLALNLNRLSYRVAFPVKNLDEWEFKFKANTEMTAYRIVVILTIISLIAAMLIYEYRPDFVLAANKLVAISILWMVSVFILPLAVTSWQIKPLRD